jgi:hypothetical protein
MYLFSQLGHQSRHFLLLAFELPVLPEQCQPCLGCHLQFLSTRRKQATFISTT